MKAWNEVIQKDLRDMALNREVAGDRGTVHKADAYKHIRSL